MSRPYSDFAVTVMCSARQQCFAMLRDAAACLPIRRVCSTCSAHRTVPRLRLHVSLTGRHTESRIDLRVNLLLSASTPFKRVSCWISCARSRRMPSYSFSSSGT